MRPLMERLRERGFRPTAAWGVGRWDPSWVELAREVYAGLDVYWCALQSSHYPDPEPVAQGLAGALSGALGDLPEKIRAKGWPKPELVRLVVGGEGRDILRALREWLQTVRTICASAWSGPRAGTGEHQPSLWDLSAWLEQAGFVLVGLTPRQPDEPGATTPVDACFLSRSWYWELAGQRPQRDLVVLEESHRRGAGSQTMEDRWGG